MSHLKERREKICLNCNAQLSGAYCPICGQENIEPKESVWHLATHFFNDITHFDGKFFTTLGLLIRRPGYLPNEYSMGRRMSYLNPIRMYIFTSAIFFLIFFSFFHIEEVNINNSIQIEGKTFTQIRSLPRDSLAVFTAKINNGRSIPYEALTTYFDSIKNTEGFHITSRKYKTKQEYDSVLKNGIKHHNWLQQKLIYKEIEANAKYHNSLSQFIGSVATIFIHGFPQMLFVSLPIFALFLKLLYWRQKDYYYVSHGIFSIHYYIFVFLILGLFFGLRELNRLMHLDWLRFIPGLLGFILVFYLYMAMLNFYQQPASKTFLKFLLLIILSIFMIAGIFVFFLVFSYMKI